MCSGHRLQHTHPACQGLLPTTAGARPPSRWAGLRVVSARDTAIGRVSLWGRSSNSPGQGEKKQNPLTLSFGPLQLAHHWRPHFPPPTAVGWARTWKGRGRRPRRSPRVWLASSLSSTTVFCWAWGCLVSGEPESGVLDSARSQGPPSRGAPGSQTPPGQVASGVCGMAPGSKA